MSLSLADRELITMQVSVAGFDGESALLGHELAYCLGQLKDSAALPILTKVLQDENEHIMVRHEASSLSLFPLSLSSQRANLNIIYRQRKLWEQLEIQLLWKYSEPI